MQFDVILEHLSDFEGAYYVFSSKTVQALKGKTNLCDNCEELLAENKKREIVVSSFSSFVPMCFVFLLVSRVKE
jgi:hypothetical protein